MRCALRLVLGGALGHIIDRIHLHEVVDFLDFGIGDLSWPVFNFADSFVTVGIALLALAYSRHSGREAAGEKDTSSPEEQIARG